MNATKKKDVKVRYITFDQTSESTWESYIKDEEEISLEWLRSLPPMNSNDDDDDDNNPQFEISILDPSGDWIKIDTDSDLTLELENHKEDKTIKFTFKKIFGGFEWNSVDSILGSLCGNTESCAAVAAVAKGMINDPNMRAYLDSLAQQIFTDSSLLSEALREAVLSLSGDAQEDVFKAESCKKEQNNSSDKTIEEILREMSGCKKAQPKESPSAAEPAAEQPDPKKDEKSDAGSSKSESNDESNVELAQSSSSSQHADSNSDNQIKQATAAVEEKKSSFFDLFRSKDKKEKEFLKCKEELRKINIVCSDDEIKSVLSHHKTSEKAVCALLQKYGDN